MKAEDLNIFILSHKSPNKCETLDTLNKLNFKGNVFILIDDEDDYLQDYKTNYKNNLVIFHKQKYLDIVDLGFSLKGLKTYSHPIFARNAVEDIAREKGFDHYIVADDDIYGFAFRPLLDNSDSLPSIAITDINESLLEYYNYMKTCDIACVGLGTGNLYIGGRSSVENGAYLNKRFVCNFYMRNLSHNIQWTLSVDDFSTSVRYGAKGELFFPLHPIQVLVRPQFMQKGYSQKLDGMSEYYRSTSSFTRSFPTFMACPSFIRVKYWRGDYIPFLNKKTAFPKIISDKYKK